MNDQQDDESIGLLLRGVGKRDLPSAEIMEDVRSAVHGEWRDMIDQRLRRRRFIGYALAASVAAVALATALTLQLRSTASLPVATVARVDGALQVARSGNGEWRMAANGARISTGDTLRTDEGSRAALDFGGISMRIDAGSLIEIAATDRIVLDGGAVYIDADPRAAASRQAEAFVVGTPYGSVRHLGTQYLVRTARNAIEVSVREGLVEIAREGDTQRAQAGERLTVPASGAVVRGTVSAQDVDWQWAARIAPPFNIDHQPLTSFLDWVGRETGKQVHYADAGLREQASGVILRGSAGDLAPEQALGAVLATTSLAYTETGTAIEIHHR